jgi:hypothetical protein
MQVKRVATWLLFAVAVLSLPLCLLPIIVWVGFAVPWMVNDFEVINNSGETVFITPVNIGSESERIIVVPRNSMGQLQALRQKEFRLSAGETLHILFNAEGVHPNALVIRNEAGEYRQLALNKGVGLPLSSDPVVYTIGSLSTLPDVDENVVGTVQQTNSFNFDLKYWGRIFIVILLGVVPIFLFSIWFRLVRRRWTGSKKSRVAWPETRA